MEENNNVTYTDKKDIYEKFKELGSATVYEASGKRGALFSGIRTLFPEMVLCGPAVTVKVSPADNLLVHKAIYEAQSDDILVVDTGDYIEAGFWGEVMTVASEAVGIKGLVTNGAIRDTIAIREHHFPVCCQGVCIKGTNKDSKGWINLPLIIGGVKINPGDIILGDYDGVVVIEKDRIESVLDASIKRDEDEKIKFEKLKSGATTLDLYGFYNQLSIIGIE